MLEVGSAIEAPDFRAPPYDLGSFREIAYRQDPESQSWRNRIVWYRVRIRWGEGRNSRRGRHLHAG